MSLRVLSVVQWFGILAGALTWTAQHVIGYGVGEAECSAGGLHWGIENDVWQLALLASAGLVVVLAECAALVVFLRTRGADVGDGPAADGRWQGQSPYGRLHFFATAALAANVLFLTIMLLDGLGSTFAVLCRQS